MAIIEKLGGGDKTNGSCASVAFAYVGNKNGLDVTDFRGGGSQMIFSRSGNIEQIIKTLSEDKNLKMLWKDYQEKFKYAKKVEYEETIKAIEFIKEIII